MMLPASSVNKVIIIIHEGFNIVWCLRSWILDLTCQASRWASFSISLSLGFSSVKEDDNAAHLLGCSGDAVR